MLQNHRGCGSAVFQVVAMLLEDGSQGNMDPEATTTVKEEEGSSNTGCSVCGDAARLLRLRWCSFQVVAMLLKDGNREDMDREATATVEEEEGSRNACYGCSVWLRQREEEVEEGTIVAKEGNNGMADAGIAWKEQCKRSLLAMTTEDGCEISLLAALYNERSLLVVIKSLLATIKVDGYERSLLATTKEDNNERYIESQILMRRSI
ncbi:hypothetical protein BHE74_00052328 [Ensete ventricosum]|nr:hypothetical protein BHE74_00052328 [Ensete ventricosum]